MMVNGIEEWDSYEHMHTFKYTHIKHRFNFMLFIHIEYFLFLKYIRRYKILTKHHLTSHYTATLLQLPSVSIKKVYENEKLYHSNEKEAPRAILFIYTTHTHTHSSTHTHTYCDSIIIIIYTPASVGETSCIGRSTRNISFWCNRESYLRGWVCTQQINPFSISLFLRSPLPPTTTTTPHLVHYSIISHS